MKCNDCGNTRGYYKYQVAYGKIINRYDPDGTYSNDQTDTHENIFYGKEHKTKYCSCCSKPLTKKEIEANYE